MDSHLRGNDKNLTSGFEVAILRLWVGIIVDGD